MVTRAKSSKELHIRLPVAMLEQLAALAERNMSTPSHEARIAIRKHLEQENGK
jgi:predicted DNA-binding protein